MRVEINLATLPYEDARRFYRQWLPVLVVVALATLALIYAAISGWSQARSINRDIAHVKSEIARLDRDKAAAQAVLNRPEHHQLRQQSHFLNELFVRKAFSWTQVFADLEKVMPPRVHVLSIRPQLNPQNQLEVRLLVAGDNREHAVELVRGLEKSPRFRQAQVISETAQGEKNGGSVQFEISAQYIPALQRGGA